jgi:hypothetical protein
MKTLYSHKTITKTLVGISSMFLLAGCETIVDQYGVQRQVMTPTGAAVLDTLVSTGVGAGAGALLKDQPGWMNGMISSLSGSVASQLVDAVSEQNQRPSYPYRGYSQPIPTQIRPQTYGGYPNAQYNQYSQYNQYQQYPQYQGQRQSQPLYTRLPNGQFVPVNP